eukprot:TRINITY_DN14564_c0_g1_i1.p1 TRINITY_DN14564_c0_g1~~TRINITY_DN14564_c0_g1_i1.p1  ORF type:complete len:340 (-),score=76.04 TRINITY_DN14564_c0_g1_i1:295-1218(-)
MPRAPKSPATKSPRKKAAASGAVVRKTRPSYAVMITRALYDHYTREKRTGISASSIATFISSTFPVPEAFKKYLRAALKAGVEEGRFRRLGKSLYRLSAKTRSQIEKPRKRRSTKKKATKKTTKKTGAKKTKTAAKTGRSKSTSKAPTKKRKSSETAAKKPRATKKAAGDKPAKAARTKKDPADRKKKAVKAAAIPNEGANDAAGAAETAADGETVARVYGNRLPKYEYIWQFRENDGRFHNYDIAASDVCEEVYQNYLGNRGDTDVRSVKSGQWNYMVDFMAFKQTNIDHHAHTVRDCRRVKWVSV